MIVKLMVKIKITTTTMIVIIITIKNADENCVVNNNDKILKNHDNDHNKNHIVKIINCFSMHGHKKVACTYKIVNSDYENCCHCKIIMS